VNPADVQQSEALATALKRLERSDAFESEIRALLEQKGFAEGVQTAVVNHLRGKGVLNDRRTAEGLARKMSSRSKGVEQLKQQLLKRGAPEDVIELCLASETADVQRVQALSLLAKRAGSVDTRAKAGRLLHSRGFSEDLIERLLDERFPLQDD
jgi:regulatory protein